MNSRLVWVAGPSRTGTSMVAGLFAAHGVFFGRCGKGDEFNPKGYFEHPYLKSLLGEPPPDDWPGAWWERMRADGWSGGPCGVKGGQRPEPFVEALDPSVVVICRRPVEQVATSRARVPWANGDPAKVTEKVYRKLDAMQWPRFVVSVRTPVLIAGNFADVLPAFDALGIEFDPGLAHDWIDPSIWGRKR